MDPLSSITNRLALPEAPMPETSHASSPRRSDMSTDAAPCFHRTLEAIVAHLEALSAVPKADLQFGDLVLVTTANSTYSIYALENGRYSVSGGWFDRHGLSPMETEITGCTWGGSVIKVDIMAACGLHLEFSNRVVTSAIRKLQVIRCEGKRVN